ncbi:hypothetical protein J2S34_003727 [Nitrobacter winogradskyi]|uniref:Uncharacterized protein n=2 Tax=Nitrobacter winogradskyi TaxID=913 RepID=A0ACC6ANL5_NITWI|nr:hypothetical protein [Nitrobacter winogradskyi]MCP2001241.1 hypothetical protein [Nitrobacter winogradskyi]
MMQLMAIMDQKLDDTQQTIMGILAETLGLQAQIAAAYTTKNVIRSAHNKNELEYRRFRTKLIDEASTIESTSRAATPLSLVCANWHVHELVEQVASTDTFKGGNRKSPAELKKTTGSRKLSFQTYEVSSVF